MASFLDKLSDTITIKSKEIVKKAKDMADVASLKSQINNQQDIVNRSYMILGKAYYNENKNAPSKDKEEIFQTIQTALEKIENLKLELEAIKGTDYCPNCNAQVSNSATYCSECGIKLEPDMPESKDVILSRVCPSCGMITNVNSAFCTGCGNKLKEEESDSAND